ncbi:RICIN domain-containing protein [Nostoc sp. FACHB-87]|uniref:RICIN domain-containing protein n=1 Tax=Nostocaceae TaxID=1162 RepID=UPI001685BC49|nr:MULTISPECIES: RICIN domain-containing protein [Nostocaceae]MBD2456283.1 RICIN domain-containing protein [Nostoc sp. FACHB-87]MBD2477704.1 RICIN domain-containing protein [Anabaena sp. FACHB-83]
MVATPIKTQNLSVTYGTDGTKIASGKTTPGATDWKTGGNVGSDGVYVYIDTSAAGFTSVPTYVITVGGKNHHWGISGSSSIYNPTAKGFEVEIRWEQGYSQSGTAVTPAVANQNEWHINWIAIEPASAKTPRPTAGKYYYLVVKHTGKVLNVTGGSKEDNIQLIQYDKSDSDNSKWLLEDTGDGSYYLVAKHSGKVANIAGGGSVDGSNAVQYQKGNNDNSKWLLEDAGDGYFYIIGKQSGKVLQVNGGNKENGAKVDQWTRQNVDHHKWKFEAV